MTPTLSRLPARPKDEDEIQDQVRVQSAARTVEPVPPLRKPAGKTGSDDFPKRIKCLSESLEQATTLESLLDESVAGIRASGIFDAFAFYLTEPPDWRFVLARCFPDSGDARARMGAVAEDSIRSGQFGSALRRGDPVTFPAEKGRRSGGILLQGLSTRSQSHGMFIGLLDADPKISAAATDRAAALIAVVSGSLAGLRRQLDYRRLCKELQGRTMEQTRKSRELASRIAEESALGEHAREKLAAALEAVNRAEGVSLMAAGLAHDFNNVLAAVKSSLVLAREARTTGPRGAEQWFEHAAGAADRARGLASQLLAVARGETPRTWKTDLGVLLRESIDFCMRGSIAVKQIDIPAGLWAIEADPGQIFQVVLNLVTNAKCAMPTGGKLGVRAWNQCGSGGRFVSFSISDTGTGIQPEDMRRIFTPGFTTKPCGSGIGMATCRAIVHRHGGSIRVESIPGDRTVVEVTLPAVDQNMSV